MHIQLLSFKYNVYHKEIEPKSAAASWNATSSCCQLCMRVASFYELLKISLALLVKTPAYTTGTTSKHQRSKWPELYPKSIVFLRLVACHMSVLSLAQCLRLQCRMVRCYQKRSKKPISTSNFETSSHRNVTAKKPIRNIYFMYVDMAWSDSLSRLEHDMLHSTVWPVHKICTMSMCWRPYLIRTKRMLFCLSFPECYPYNRNLWFLLKSVRKNKNENNSCIFNILLPSIGELASSPTFGHDLYVIYMQSLIG